MTEKTSFFKETKKTLCRFINNSRKEILKLCSDMVKIPSENPPGNMETIASYLKDWLEERGFTVKSYEPENGRISLVTSIGESEKPSLILNGHMDVVPAGDLKRWQFPPYSGKITNGKIFGRGTTDMKGGLTSIITAFVAISEVMDKIPGKIILTAVPDEETGGEYGTGWLVKNNKISGNACLIGEPSGINGSFIGEKGLCWLRFEAKGVPAHGSLPTIGESAIEKMMRALAVIRKIEKEKVKMPEDILETIAISKDFYKDIALVKVNDESKAKNVARAVDHNTVNFGVIKGGTKINIVPESCTVDADIRVPLGTTSEEVKNHIVRLLKEAGLADIKCSFIFKSEANYTPPTKKIFAILKQNVKEIIGIDLKPLYFTATTDGKFLRSKGIPTLNYGPGDLTFAHTYNEQIQTENIITVAKIIAGSTLDFLHIHV